MTSMIQSRLISPDINSPIWDLTSLRDNQVSSIIAGLKGLVVEWSVERHESCDGHLSLVLMSSARDMTIVINRASSSIMISVMYGDELQAGSYRCSSSAEATEMIKAIAGDPKLSHAQHIA